MITGILFDKDGTLFDFQLTWSKFTAQLLAELSQGDPMLAAHLGAAVGYDLETATFAPDSLIIAHTVHEIELYREEATPGKQVVVTQDVDILKERLVESTSQAIELAYEELVVNEIPTNRSTE